MDNRGNHPVPTTDYTAEELEQIEYFAALFFAEEEILQIIRPSLHLSPFDRSVLKGRLKGEAQLRQSLLTASANGSSPAQTQLAKLADKCRLAQKLQAIE